MKVNSGLLDRPSDPVPLTQSSDIRSQQNGRTQYDCETHEENGEV
jgi:hypothetical protein